jgi:hypothetical protein
MFFFLNFLACTSRWVITVVQVLSHAILE